MRRPRLIIGTSPRSPSPRWPWRRAAAAAATSEAGGKITLDFSSYAWQDPTVAATKDIVAAWNTAHPNIQVKYLPVDPDSVHDKLVTQFAGRQRAGHHPRRGRRHRRLRQPGLSGRHDQADPGRPEDSVPQGIWDSVSFNGKVYGAPTLLQSYVVFANKTLLAKANIPLPTARTRGPGTSSRPRPSSSPPAARTVSAGASSSPLATVLSLALNFGGTFITGNGSSSKLTFGAGEQQVPQRIHDMIFTDKSIAPTTVGMSGTDVLPGFFAGKYAMIVGGNYSQPADGRAGAEGLPVGDAADAQGRLAAAGRRPADAVDRRPRASTRKRRWSSSRSTTTRTTWPGSPRATG